MDQRRIDAIAEEIVRRLQTIAPDRPAPAPQPDVEDITSERVRRTPLLRSPANPEALERMMRRTTARIGVGRAGARLMTRTMLTLRADHAQARDAVFADVSQQVLDALGLFTVQTQCPDKNTYITRPDLGRRLSDEAVTTLKARCKPSPDVQVYAADGLSSTAIEANLPKILPVLLEAL